MPMTTSEDVVFRNKFLSYDDWRSNVMDRIEIPEFHKSIGQRQCSESKVDGTFFMSPRRWAKQGIGRFVWDFHSEKVRQYSTEANLIVFMLKTLKYDRSHCLAAWIIKNKITNRKCVRAHGYGDRKCWNMKHVTRFHFIQLHTIAPMRWYFNYLFHISVQHCSLCSRVPKAIWSM